MSEEDSKESLSRATAPDDRSEERSAHLREALLDDLRYLLAQPIVPEAFKRELRKHLPELM